ncbi:hypothetical protein PT2222_70147 [Paraburkholderia tropica]
MAHDGRGPASINNARARTHTETHGIAQSNGRYIVARFARFHATSSRADTHAQAPDSRHASSTDAHSLAHDRAVNWLPHSPGKLHRASHRASAEPWRQRRRFRRAQRG